SVAADKAGVDLRVFQGRGGPVSPGGGKAHADIIGSPPGTMRGRARVLEPGELVATKFGVRAIALRTLEQALAAMIEATLKPPAPGSGEHSDREEILSTLAGASRDHYPDLVVHSPGFADHYRLSTPADVIELVRRGTGPVATAAEG